MKKQIACTGLGLAVLFFTACIASVEVGELREEREALDLLGTESVDVEIDMGVGTLDLGGGSDRLVDAEFRYNVEEWKPAIDYAVENGRGKLRLRQTGTKARRVPRQAKCEWDLKLNGDVPMVLDVDLGAGRGTLRLADLNLTEAAVDLGAGEVLIDLSGNASLSKLDVGMGAGNATLDLSGSWADDLEAEINGGVGECTVILPTATGARVRVDKGIGKLNIAGLRKDGDYYVNDAYGTTDATLHVDVAAGVGSINLKVGGSI
jgi:hypothetical protein